VVLLNKTHGYFAANMKRFPHLVRERLHSSVFGDHNDCSLEVGILQVENPDKKGQVNVKLLQVKRP
jgi:hypothetical protein